MHREVSFRPGFRTAQRAYRGGWSAMDKQFRRPKHMSSFSVYAKTSSFRNAGHSELEHPISFSLHLISYRYD